MVSENVQVINKILIGYGIILIMCAWYVLTTNIKNKLQVRQKKCISLY